MIATSSEAVDIPIIGPPITHLGGFQVGPGLLQQKNAGGSDGHQVVARLLHVVPRNGNHALNQPPALGYQITHLGQGADIVDCHTDIRGYAA